MIYHLCNQIKADKPPRLFKHGEQKRDHIYVKDIINANLLAMEASSSGICNIGTGVAMSFNQIVSLLNDTLGTSYEPEYFDNPYSFFQTHTQASTNAAKQLIGFETRYRVRESMAEYLKDRRHQYSL